MSLAQINWGSVPDWLSGLGTILALVFAGLAVRAAHRTNVQQSKQLEMLEEDRRRSQASRVAAWCFTGSKGEPTYRITNTSGLPVFRVELWAIDGDGISPGRSDVTKLSFVPVGDSNVAIEVGQLNDAANDQRLLVEMSFMDCAGASWARRARGELIEQKGPGHTDVG